MSRSAHFGVTNLIILAHDGLDMEPTIPTITIEVRYGLQDLLTLIHMNFPRHRIADRNSKVYRNQGIYHYKKGLCI